MCLCKPCVILLCILVAKLSCPCERTARTTARAANPDTAATATKRIAPEYGAAAPPPAPVTMYRTPATSSTIATAAAGSIRSFV